MRAHGFGPVTLVSPQSPNDIVTYYVETLNVLNDLSAGTSHIQYYEKIPAIKASWDAKRQGGRKGKPEDDTDGTPTKETFTPGKRTQRGYESEYYAHVTATFPAFEWGSNS
eukprot:4331257-Alexandrium_andersonii.AAC.1